MPDSTSRPEERILAVDPGSRRVGLAIGTSRDRIATRLATLDLGGKGSGEEMLERIAEVALSEEATRLLIGLPLNMDGTEGREARKARTLGENLARRTGLPVVFVDERLSSEAAHAAAREAGARRRSKKPVDDLAAAILLQGWFDDEAAREARERWRNP